MNMISLSIGHEKVNIPNKPIGLSFSAGIDSTILLYYLMQQTSVRLHLFTITAVDRHFSTMRYCADVLAYLCHRFPNKDIQQHYTIVDDTDGAMNNFFKLPGEFLYRKKIGSLFYGTNAIPLPAELDLQWPEKGTTEYKYRDPYTIKPIEMQPNWFYPLINMNKKDIAQLYEQEQLSDLAKLTKSCGTEYGEPPCKECFFCREKFWGFGHF